MIWKEFQIVAKIRIVYSVIFTGFVGFVMARRDFPYFDEAFILIVILFFSSSSAAIMNNLLDRDIDQKMIRTMSREAVIQKFGAKKLWIWSIITTMGALILAFFWFNWVVPTLIALATLSYVLWYTLILKRKDPYGTILGGLPGALPIPIGAYAASTREMPDVWLLFLWMMAWQPAHFWALSLCKADEYRKAQIPILPVIRGERLTHVFIYLYATPLIPITVLMAFAGGYGLLFLIPATLIGIYYLVITIRALEVLNKPMISFFASLIYLIGIYTALLADIFLTPLINL